MAGLLLKRHGDSLHGRREVGRHRGVYFGGLARQAQAN
jgi:hypothetical protein